MAEKLSRRSFPSLPSKNWWDLRRKFVQSPPRQVTGDYIQSVLGIDKGAARNLIPPLRAVGLIDADGKPTQLAMDWRTDEHYVDVCGKIFESIYPQDLRDALPAPVPNREGVEKWFMRNTGTGQAAARKMAAFYLLVAQADVKRQEQPVSTFRSGGGETKPSRKPPTKPRPEEAPPPVTPRLGHSSPSTGGGIPSFHLDVQIHIAADASPSQIDQVFACMAKHLYGRIE